MFRDHAGIECAGKGCIGPLQVRQDPTQVRGAAVNQATAVNRHIAIHRQEADRRIPAGRIEELARWIHLPRLGCERQHVITRHPASVGQCVPHQHLCLVVVATRERSDAQAELRVGPVRRRNRQVTVLQGLRQLDIGPGHQLAVHPHERSDTDSATAQLHRAVLAEQPLLASTIDTDDGPVRLLAGKPAWIRSTNGLGGNGLDEGVRRCPEGQRLHCDVAQLRRSRAERTHAQPARLRFGQGDGIVAAIAAPDRAQGAPRAAIFGYLDCIVGDRLALLPAQDRATEFAHAAQIVGPCAVEAGERAGQRQAVVDRQFPDCQFIDARTALAATLAGADGQLEAFGRAQGAVGGGAPCKIDLPLLQLGRGPRRGQRQIGLVAPPDVVAAGVGQLEFQVVGRPAAAQLHAELVIRGIADRQGAACDRIAGHAIEVVVQAECLAAGAIHLPQRGNDVVGGRGPPRSDVIEAVEHAEVLGLRDRCQQQQR